jgi:hypothetical protein
MAVTVKASTYVTIKPEAPAITPAQANAYIYSSESSNRLDAINTNSGACGLGQSLPCSKLTSACQDWQTDYACQDNYFTGYMLRRYGSWLAAMVFHEANGWW